MSLEQISIPFPKYFVDKVEEELKQQLGRDVEDEEIYAWIFLLTTSGYLNRTK